MLASERTSSIFGVQADSESAAERSETAPIAQHAVQRRRS